MCIRDSSLACMLLHLFQGSYRATDLPRGNHNYADTEPLKYAEFDPLSSAESDPLSSAELYFFLNTEYSTSPTAENETLSYKPTQVVKFKLYWDGQTRCTGRACSYSC